MSMKHTLTSSLLLASLAVAGSASAATVFDDSFADGSLAKTGVDDTNWWTSSSNPGIEIAPGSLGLVTGNSGRGIHTIFSTQTLVNVGDKLIATYTFTTPATVGSSGGGFRVGLFDDLGRAGLNANVVASLSSPNPLYGLGSQPGLPGYYLDMDVNTGSEDFSFRPNDATNLSGRLLSTTVGFGSAISGLDAGSYAFVANTTYTGSFTVELIDPTNVSLTATLDTGSFTTTMPVTATNLAMLAFHANSNVFGSINTQNTPDNGIDFSNIKVEFVPIPEPATLSLVGLGGLMLLRRR